MNRAKDDGSPKPPRPEKPRPVSDQWCETHWERVKAEKGINGVKATMEIMQRFIERGTREKFLRPRMTPDQQNAAMAKRAPLCCWLGQPAMDEVYVVAGGARGSE